MIKKLVKYIFHKEPKYIKMAPFLYINRVETIELCNSHLQTPHSQQTITGHITYQLDPKNLPHTIVELVKHHDIKESYNLIKLYQQLRSELTECFDKYENQLNYFAQDLNKEIVRLHPSQRSHITVKLAVLQDLINLSNKLPLYHKHSHEYLSSISSILPFLSKTYNVSNDLEHYPSLQYIYNYAKGNILTQEPVPLQNLNLEI